MAPRIGVGSGKRKKFAPWVCRSCSRSAHCHTTKLRQVWQIDHNLLPLNFFRASPTTFSREINKGRHSLYYSPVFCFLSFFVFFERGCWEKFAGKMQESGVFLRQKGATMSCKICSSHGSLEWGENWSPFSFPFNSSQLPSYPVKLVQFWFLSLFYFSSFYSFLLIRDNSPFP